MALLFHHPLVEVELVEDGGGDEVVVEGPGWATGDLTLATILARRELAWRKKLGRRHLEPGGQPPSYAAAWARLSPVSTALTHSPS